MKPSLVSPLRPAVAGALALSALLALSAGVPGQTALLLHSPKNGWWGGAVVPLGDLNGDGLGDLAVAKMGAHGFNGRIEAVSGLDGTWLRDYTHPPWTNTVNLGHTMVAAGDLDSDGVTDLLAGAPGSTGFAWPGGPFGSEIGGALLFSGSTAQLIHSWQGDAEGDLFGWSVARLADLDGDGAPDLAVGAPQRRDATHAGTGPGYVRVFSGASGWLLREIAGTTPEGGFGHAIASAGDLDRDGLPDLLVGAPWADGVLPGSGAVRAYRVSDGAELFGWPGKQAGEEFGAAVAGPGDMDGDGWPEVAIGAPLRDGVGPDLGHVTVFSVASGASSVLIDLPGDPAGLDLGRVLGSPGDLDRDGRAELLVGAPLPTVSMPEGRAVVLSGDGSLAYDIRQMALPNALLRIGAFVGPAGDLDGNGVLDFVVRSPHVITGGGDTYNILGHDLVVVYSGTPLSFYSTSLGWQAGAGGPPLLSGTGGTAAGQAFTVELEQAAPMAPVYFVLGTSVQWGPFIDHKMVPTMDMVVAGLMTDGSGALSLPSHWPAGIPALTAFYLQAWVQDPSGPDGFSSSGALHITAQ